MVDLRRRSVPPPLQWIWLGSDAVVVVLAVVWILTGALWSLLLWEAVAVVYLVGGLVGVWGGSSQRNGSPDAARFVMRLAWILPLMASVVGSYAAAVALVTDRAAAQPVFTAAAALGVVISWALLNTGFAEIYQSVDEAEDGVKGIEFPGEPSDAFLNFLYFSVTVGATFATSDAQVRTLAVRRIVMVHTVVSFFYNALIVASAVTVLRELVAS